jgi:hypothetical protein
MPSPVPRNSRVTEVRVLSYAELCCLGDLGYYDPLRLPLHRHSFRLWPYDRGMLPRLSTLPRVQEGLPI